MPAKNSAKTSMFVSSYIAFIVHSFSKEKSNIRVDNKYPNLKTEIKWNQPMFTDHGTFIIGFSVSKKHLAVAPESVTIAHVEDDIKTAGYDYTKELVRIPWNSPVDYSLLEKMIEFNIWDKADCITFWRK